MKQVWIGHVRFGINFIDYIVTVLALPSREYFDVN